MNSSGKETKSGIIYTFYSFKGGSGRTMALANVAALMAKWGYKVLVVDWDLEAPGVERFFAQNNPKAGSLRASSPGIADLIQARANQKELDWRQCVLEFEPGISVITAGRDDDEYVGKIQRLNFDVLFEKYDLGSYIEQLRKEWISAFDFVLIDSRTGVTDIGGICTVHLPDVLVVLFTATHASTEGALQIVERARKAQGRLPLDRGHLIAVPVPARDESRTEYERATRWAAIFANLFHDFYGDWLPSGIKVPEAIELLRIPYVPYWSFGEELPVLAEGTSDPRSLGYAYEILARLLTTRLSWYEAFEGRKLAPPPTTKTRELDKDWLNSHRAAAMEGLERSKRKGFMEAYHFCLDAFIDKQQPELLSAAGQAAVHTFGWPIGVVLHNRPELRPQPTNDGIVAELSTEHDYDYWALTKGGDFYTLTSLLEDYIAEAAIHFNTRIMRITEVILHSVNLYKALGAEPGTSVALTIRHGGLRGRSLSSSTRNSLLSVFPPGNVREDEVAATVSFHIGVSEPEIVKLVKSLCEPLFIIFNFKKFDDSTYEQIVTRFIQGIAT